MQIRRLTLFVVLFAVAAGSAAASTIKMRGGTGSEPFTTLDFGIDLNSTGADCVGNPGCVFKNEVYQNGNPVTITQIDFIFNIPQPPSGSFSCGIDIGSPFSSCEVVLTPNAQDPTQATFEFFNGSLPVGSDFSLDIPTSDPFPPNTELGARGNPNTVPEPGSAALVLTSLAGALLLVGRRILSA
jgi:hypothetical protein